ncbi:hypothetical protein [Calothrix sp. NIES-2098]|uniref:hypothetical protein n=1 Tax=Calothrix sp. NIES-2098 TaxID=1954171 RepID=UPI0030DCCFD8
MKNATGRIDYVKHCNNMFSIKHPDDLRGSDLLKGDRDLSVPVSSHSRNWIVIIAKHYICCDRLILRKNCCLTITAVFVGETTGVKRQKTFTIDFCTIFNGIFICATVVLSACTVVTTKPTTLHTSKTKLTNRIRQRRSRRVG